MSTAFRLGLALLVWLGSLHSGAASLAVGAQPSGQAIGLPPGLDIAIGQPVETSTSDARASADAVDGDPATAWCPSGSNVGAELTVSFDRPHSVTGAVVTWHGQAPAWSELHVSDDGLNWRSLARQHAGTGTHTRYDPPAGPSIPIRSARLRFSDPAARPCVAALRVFAAPPRASSLVRGADLSTLTALEAAGKSFSDAAGTRAAEQILADHDLNLVRLRLWVNPATGLNTLDDVAAMARRIKRANLQFLLNLHLSDFWADPTHQETPAAWQGQDLPTLAASVHDYARSVVAALDRQGTPPEIVQIGNEVSTGMLWPQGKIYVDGQQRWAEFTTLLAAGIAGARAGGSPGRVPRIMVHIEQGGDTEGAQWFYDHLREHGVDFDLIGLSYYRYWQGSLSDLRANLANLALRYGKPIMIVETAHPWTLADQDGSDNIVGPAAGLPPDYPPTPQGQAFLVRDVLSLVAQTPGNLGLGVVYWEPAWIPGVGWQPGEGAVWDNQTLFDAQGRALESIEALRVSVPDAGARSRARAFGSFYD